jgi:hypothetical protein
MDKEFHMSKIRKLGAAALVACVVAAATPAQAHQAGSIGAVKSEFVSLFLALFPGPKGPLPPPA